ncbi:hypothetical protein HEK616_40540 [Streptomyces nigrescens]|uniref:Holliday junction resolvase n=1 Tax=Streptomyces nigrescens TaxID=1920 RepID=A0ABM7ZW23_STRNI|nr:hypothetical protein [Streptomyces nigrescens]BDM70567.1 hypothetical protein HEK616_40540 [Streptomyces nigrescens]
MSNANKAKGTRYESELRDYLNDLGFTVRRVVQMGNKDQGDLHGYPLHIIEAKNVKSIDLPSFVRQADREAINAGEPFGVAFVKKARGATGDGYAVRSIATDVRLVARLRDMEEALKDADFDRWYDIDEEHREAS